jgi:hypothetical protein
MSMLDGALKVYGIEQTLYEHGLRDLLIRKPEGARRLSK